MPLVLSLAEGRELARLGLPILVAQLSQIGMTFVDTVMTGRYSAGALAGVAVAGSVWVPAVLFAVGCLHALPAMSAQLAGAKKPERSAHLLRQGMALSVLLSLLLTVLLFFISARLDLFGLEEEVAEVARGYMLALLPGLPGFFFFISLRSFLEGFGRTRPAMIIGLFCLLLNIPCNWIFIYGRLGMPEMGGAGCGVATSICYWAMCLSMLFFLHRDRKLGRFSVLRPRQPVPGQGLPPLLDLPLLTRIVRVGLPNAVALCVECSLFALTALLLAPLGTDTVAAHQITINYGGIIFAIPLSIGMTVTIRVGQHLGAGRRLRARSAAHTALVLGCLTGLASLACTVLFRESIVALYSSDPGVIGPALGLMFYCGLYQIADALQAISCGALRGYNDTRIISAVCLVSYGFLGLGGGWILGRTDLVVPAMGAAGFWIGYIMALASCALCYLWRLTRLHALPMETIRGRLAE